MTHGSIAVAGLALVLVGAVSPQSAAATGGRGPKPVVGWTEVQPSAPWAPRAGLKAVALGDRFYLMGGRTPNPPSFPPVPGDSIIWGDVWTSKDRGSTWHQLVASDEPGHWAPRAYFGAVTKGGAMYVLGGQDFEVVPNACPPFVPDCPPFVSTSTFFNDVWRSKDGVHWDQMTGPGSAPLSFATRSTSSADRRTTTRRSSAARLSASISTTCGNRATAGPGRSSPITRPGLPGQAPRR
jgi:hypothetical protein